MKYTIQNVANEISSKNIALLMVDLLDILFMIMFLKWKKWALYGLAMNTIVMFIYNLSEGYGFFLSVLGLFGFFIICALLFLKKDGRTGYQNLK
ncbi:hypothetical protein [Chryseobacterium lathyri]|uniref:hypothetical protein n=1 Tax=Chryseobacterium lathyri TaxID=395933 RepID=UPI0011BD4F5F|nr:hypothetical protein [Chryseobacterium lathyri]